MGHGQSDGQILAHANLQHLWLEMEPEPGSLERQGARAYRRRILG